MSRYNIKKRTDALTPVISVILVIAVVTTSIGTILVFSDSYVDEVKTKKKQEEAEMQIRVLSDEVNELTYGNPGTSKTTKVTTGDDSTIEIDNDYDRIIAMYNLVDGYDFTVDDLGDSDSTFTLNMLEDGKCNNIQVFWLDVDDTCFLAGTKILMSDGLYRNIEDVEIGDKVVSYDEVQKEIVTSKISEIFHHNPNEMPGYYLKLNNDLKVTPNHRFYSNNNWVYAGDLKIGDTLFTKDNNENYHIFSIEKIFTRVPTYDLEIEKYHTYFVKIQEHDVLVHNPTMPPSGSEFSVTFEIVDPDWGSILFDGMEYRDGEEGLFPQGEYEIQALPDLGRFFDIWIPANGVSVPEGENTNPQTTAIVGGDGILLVYFSDRPVERIINFYTTPSSGGTIYFDSNPYEHGQSTGTNIGTHNIIAEAPANYIFERWLTEYGISVTNQFAAETTAYVSYDGNLEAKFVEASNSPPIANDDYATTNEEQQVAIAVADNDTDPNGDETIDLSSISIKIQPSQGILTIDDSYPPTGIIRYTPYTNYYGSDSFKYTIKDDQGAESNQATVHITIINVNDNPVANDDYPNVPMNTCSQLNVLNNDTDVDNDQLTITGTTQPNHGSAFVNVNKVYYEPNPGYYGPDQFTYTINDGHGGTDSANVYVTVIGVNHPPNQPSNPNPVNDSVNVEINKILTWTGGDPDNDPVTYDIYFGTTSSPPKVISNQTGTTYNPGTMQYVTDYYWKIVAWDDKGEKTIGPLWTFTTRPEASQIIIVSPNIYSEWQRGTTQTIKWNIIGILTGNVTIKLHQNEDEWLIAEDIDVNQKEYDWNILSNQDIGDNYFINITCEEDNSIFDYSDLFSIINSYQGIEDTEYIENPNPDDPIWTITTSLDLKGIVIIELFSDDYENGNSPFGKILLFDSNSLTYKIPSKNGISKVSYEYGGTIKSSSGKIDTINSNRFYEYQNIFSVSIVQMVATSIKSLGAGQIGRLTTDFKGSLIGKQETQNLYPEDFKLQFHGDNEQAWNQYLVNSYDFNIEEHDLTETLVYQKSNTRLIIRHSLIEISLDI